MREDRGTDGGQVRESLPMPHKLPRSCHTPLHTPSIAHLLPHFPSTLTTYILLVNPVGTLESQPSTNKGVTLNYHWRCDVPSHSGRIILELAIFETPP